MPHPFEHSDAARPMTPGEAEALAEAMTAFTAASRLRVLYVLLEDERSVDDLARAAGLSATVTSQQLRVLRQLGAVTVRREGRHAFYRLADHHVADLLAAIRHSGEHRDLQAAPVASPLAAGRPVGRRR